MSAQAFVSYAPNREDVVLCRGLRDVDAGRYLELGVGGPDSGLIVRSFSEFGWRTFTSTTDPQSEQAEPPPNELHFVVVDSPRAQWRETFLAVRDQLPRPWVVLLRDGRSGTTPQIVASAREIMGDSRYQLCLDDGVTLFFADSDRPPALHDALSRPANTTDDVQYVSDMARHSEIDRLLTEVNRLTEALAEHDRENANAILEWRTFAMQAWTRVATNDRASELRALNEQIASHINHIRIVDERVVTLQEQLDAMEETVSWKVTQPLRRVRGATKRAHR